MPFPKRPLGVFVDACTALDRVDNRDRHPPQQYTAPPTRPKCLTSVFPSAILVQTTKERSLCPLATTYQYSFSAPSPRTISFDREPLVSF
jgi:hypothetical protein